MIALSVNLNKIALIRNSRDTTNPDVVAHAHMAIAAGADGITVHPRPDQRHIRASDCFELAAASLGVEFNIEGNPHHNLMAFVEATRPTQCTLVPDSVDQFTSDHGWRLPSDEAQLRPIIAQLKAWGVRVSLFMDPVPEAMAAAAALGADRVELYTETYARAYGTPEHAAVTETFSATARAALACGLGVNAGHDLNLENLSTFIAVVPGVSEVSIGHALVADALEQGYDATVKAYLNALA